jgi:hypothetical protein
MFLTAIRRLILITAKTMRLEAVFADLLHNFTALCAFTFIVSTCLILLKIPT